MTVAADLKRADNMTKHENDIYLIAGRYALVKRINVRKSPMQSTTHGEFRRAGDAPQSEDSFISRLHQFLLGSRTVHLYSRVETNKRLKFDQMDIHIEWPSAIQRVHLYLLLSHAMYRVKTAILSRAKNAL